MLNVYGVSNSPSMRELKEKDLDNKTSPTSKQVPGGKRCMSDFMTRRRQFWATIHSFFLGERDAGTIKATFIEA